MEIYKCQLDGYLSQSNQKECPICDGMDWIQMDPTAMSEDDWTLLLDAATGAEEELRVMEAWAETGNTEGMKLLAHLYMEGIGCKKDEAKAVEIFQRLVERKDPDAMTTLGSCYLFGTGTEKNVEKGFSLLWKAKDMKDGDAAYLLGLLYENGNMVSQDVKKAKKLYKVAAECGSDMGMFAYGVALLETAKTKKDINNAIFWYWRAACEGLGEAQLSLGSILNEPDSPIFDRDQAIYWLNRAVKNKCNGAASKLATVCLDQFYEMDQMTFDLNTHIRNLNEALDRGDCEAAKTLGDFYRDGVLGEPDPARAYKLYRMGQGQNKACSAAVAHCYHYGQGVEKNVGLAFLILSEMIDLDGKNISPDIPSSAILEFGDMYRDGEGTAQDSGIAANLYGIAVSRKDPFAKGRLARELLSGNERVFSKGDVDPITILKASCDNGDFEAALFLTKRYLSAGDQEQAVYFMKEALFWEDYYTGDRATQFAKVNFPELLNK